MTSRRGSRPTHVRPRPPSSGRPTPVKVRPRAPAPGRLSVRTPIRRSRGIPLIGRIALAVGILAVGAGVIYLGAGGLGTVAGALGSTVSDFIAGVTATPVPAATPVVTSQAPSIEAPSEPYTNQESVDLIVIVPSDLAGDPDHRLRVYLALEGPGAGPHPGGAAGRRPADDHPRDPDEGHPTTSASRSSGPGANPSRRRWSAGSST